MNAIARLLVLDDDPVMREIIAVIAEREGFVTCMVSAPEEFFIEVERFAPTHISIDLVMPMLDGIEIVCELAAQRCPAALLLISGMGAKVLDSARRVAEDRGLHVSGVLTKPFRHDALRKALRESTPLQAAVPKTTPDVTWLAISQAVIDESLECDQFIVHYQPKVCLQSGNIVGFEALVRWRHPLLGLLLPERFIGSIERNGSIHRITQRVIEKSIAWFARSQRRLRTTLSINLSALDLASETLADSVEDTCMALGVAPDRVEFELTETSAMRDPESALATLTRLRIKGFGLAIDDFGTGYSSMVQLARLPFSSMKIDRSFVMTLMSSHESRKIVASIIGLGHALGLHVVAEGVDSIAAVRTLHEMDCDVAQGFYFARALSPEDLGRFVSQWRAQEFLAGLSTQSTADERHEPPEQRAVDWRRSIAEQRL